jgi:hypothetical protein
MGAVACEKHGTHPGILSCDHVRLAAQVSGEAVAFDVYGFDMLGDAGDVIKHLICAACAARFGLSPSKLVTEEIWSDAVRFPYVCPACVHCVIQWAEKHNNPLQPIARENVRSG